MSLGCISAIHKSQHEEDIPNSHSFIYVLIPQELFEGHYFCQAQRMDFFQRAKPYKENPTIMR